MTNKKWNQWKNKNLGHDDGAERLQICEHLAKSDFKHDNICNNAFIQIEMDTGKTHGPYKILPPSRPGMRTYRPDVSVWAARCPHNPDLFNNKLYFVVEIDGTAHRKGGEGNRTSRRNQDYKDVGISCMIIDREDCKAWDISYTERLDQLLKGMLKH